MRSADKHNGEELRAESSRVAAAGADADADADADATAAAAAAAAPADAAQGKPLRRKNSLRRKADKKTVISAALDADADL